MGQSSSKAKKSAKPKKPADPNYYEQFLAFLRTYCSGNEWTLSEHQLRQRLQQAREALENPSNVDPGRSETDRYYVILCRLASCRPLWPLAYRPAVRIWDRDWKATEIGGPRPVWRLAVTLREKIFDSAQGKVPISQAGYFPPVELSHMQAKSFLAFLSYLQKAGSGWRQAVAEKLTCDKMELGGIVYPIVVTRDSISEPLTSVSRQGDGEKKVDYRPKLLLWLCCCTPC